MRKLLTATYEKGLLRPNVPQALQTLAEGQQVWIVVQDIVTDPAEQARRYEQFLRDMDRGRMWEDDVGEATEEEARNFEPLQIEGDPLSETVIKMRRGEE